MTSWENQFKSWTTANGKYLPVLVQISIKCYLILTACLLSGRVRFTKNKTRIHVLHRFTNCTYLVDNAFSTRIKQMVQSISRNCIFFTVSSLFQPSASCTYLDEQYFYHRRFAFSLPKCHTFFSKFLSRIMHVRKHLRNETLKTDLKAKYKCVS